MVPLVAIDQCEESSCALIQGELGDVIGLDGEARDARQVAEALEERSRVDTRGTSRLVGR